jgi:hypothetical protein
MEVLLSMDDFSKTFSRKIKYLLSSMSIKITKKLFDRLKNLAYISWQGRNGYQGAWESYILIVNDWCFTIIF